MTVRSLVLVPAKQMENAQTTQYTAGNVTTYVDKATFTNTSSSNVTIGVNVVTLAGSPGASNLIINTKTIAPRETYAAPELVGQVLQAGDFISTIASAATSITMRISGREIT